LQDQRFRSTDCSWLRLMRPRVVATLMASRGRPDPSLMLTPSDTTPCATWFAIRAKPSARVRSTISWT